MCNTCMYVCICMCTYIHTGTYIHTYIHTYMNERSQTCVHVAYVAGGVERRAEGVVVEGVGVVVATLS